MFESLHSDQLIIVLSRIFVPQKPPENDRPDRDSNSYFLRLSEQRLASVKIIFTNSTSKREFSVICRTGSGYGLRSISAEDYRFRPISKWLALG